MGGFFVTHFTDKNISGSARQKCSKALAKVKPYFGADLHLLQTPLEYLKLIFCGPKFSFWVFDMTQIMACKVWFFPEPCWPYHT